MLLYLGHLCPVAILPSTWLQCSTWNIPRRGV